MGLIGATGLITIAVFKNKKKGKINIEIGSSGGLEKEVMIKKI